MGAPGTAAEGRPGDQRERGAGGGKDPRGASAEGIGAGGGGWGTHGWERGSGDGVAEVGGTGSGGGAVGFSPVGVAVDPEFSWLDAGLLGQIEARWQLALADAGEHV